MTVVQSHTIQSKKSIANAKEEDEDEEANANEDEEDTKQCKCWLRRQIAEEIGFAGMTQTSCLVQTTFDWTSPLICLRFNCAQLLSNVFPRLCFDWIWPRLGWWIVRGCIALDFTWFANFMSFQLQVVCRSDQMVHKTFCLKEYSFANAIKSTFYSTLSESNCSNIQFSCSSFSILDVWAHFSTRNVCISSQGKEIPEMLVKSISNISDECASSLKPLSMLCHLGWFCEQVILAHVS